MVRYMTRDGMPLDGDAPLEVVRALRADSQEPGRNMVEFMAATAARAEMQTGFHVRSTNPESFLADLVVAGLIQPCN